MATDRILRKALIRAPLSSWGASLEQLDTKLSTKLGNWDSLILYRARLSNFLNVRNVSPQDRLLSYKEIIDIGLFQVRRTTGSPDLKRPCVALDTPTNYSETKRRLFDLAGIKYLCLPARGEDIPGAKLAEIENAWTGKHPENPRMNMRLDVDEAENIDHLLQLLRPLKLRYLPQQGLTEVFDIPKSVRNKMRERIQENNIDPSTNNVGNDFDKLTTVDGVVVTQPPACIPIAIIEFDGAIHRNSHSKDGCAKRFKDQLKNGIAEKADFPLIRLAVGDDIDDRSKMAGRTVLDSLLIGMRDILREDDHQALALHEMVFSEVRSLATDDSQNLEAMLTEYLELLEQKVKAAELVFNDALKQGHYDLGGEFPRFRADEEWQVQGFSSEEEYRESQILDRYDPDNLSFSVPNYDDTAPITTYYLRTIEPRREDFAWSVVVRYTKRIFGYKYVDRAMNDLPDQFDHELDFVFPVLVVGSKLAKSKLKQLIYQETLSALKTFEADRITEICSKLSSAWRSAVTEFFFERKVTSIRKHQTSRSVIEFLETEIGLKPGRTILSDRSQSDQHSSAPCRAAMMRRKDEWLRALHTADRQDFSPEEILMLSEDLDDKICNVKARST